ncbi:MAG: tRNA (N6-isopentenyl adenosine(37)-C2)-methylthiotransferase MiaB [Oscillospiraceae bacterium]|jgi:tRNA-2-methylthio-N6-dimethylallyladenosine synthase|nr:tRNA (N6-isopentenyl adenosine(37)-C2)-methylthiotransferase MiaB [Oscillospiraceae bacterium]
MTNNTALRARLAQLFPDAPPLAYVRTYGCQGNVSDGERLQGMLAELGFSFCASPDDADFVLLNTCAVREHAQVRVFGNVGAFKPLKKSRRRMKIAVCGCMVQQEGVAEELRRVFPFVDLIFGTHALPKLPEMLWELYENDAKVTDVENLDGSITEDLPLRRESTFRAWLPISYGCDNFCSYCVVPHVRGRERSRTPEAVLDELRRLVGEGYRDITLLGQNVNSYGKGLAETPTFPALLQAICAVPGDFRVRFMTSHPKDCSRELLAVMAENPKICRHLHLPVQSGNNEILGRMNRKYTRERYLETVQTAKALMPDLTLTSDIIVGFPGETDAQFRDTLALVRAVEYGALFTFIYSPRVGTPAAALPDPIPRAEKVARLQELCRVQEEITLRRSQSLVGQTLRVLVERVGKAEGTLAGRLESNAVVEFLGGSETIGHFIDVTITDATRLVLQGTQN